MKKIICVLLSVLFLSACVLPVAAKSKQDLLSYLKAELPSKYQSLHYVLAENVISQYDLTEAECDQLYDVLVNLRAQFADDKGASLDLYTAAQRDAVMTALDQFCAITGSTYVIKASPNPVHEGDIQVVLSKADGSQVAVLDVDAPLPARTGEFFTPSTILLIAAVALFAVAAVVVVLRRRKAATAA